MDSTQNRISLMHIDNGQSGFTLMELMIVMLIIGILSAIAVPSYHSHVTKANRTDATVMLVSSAAQQEQFFLDNKTYSTDMTDLGYGANPAPTENSIYLINVKAVSATCAIQTCYVLEAVPQGSQANDTCGTLSLSSLGTKLPAGCW